MVCKHGGIYGFLGTSWVLITTNTATRDTTINIGNIGNTGELT